MHGGARPRAGRKPAQIDLVQLEKLAALQCTDEEIACWFSLSPGTIAKRRKKPEFAEALSRGRARGRISVRRAQMKLLTAGNASIAVWLGRQLLGQRDVITTEHTGSGGEPIQVEAKPDLKRLSDDELHQLKALIQKASSKQGEGDRLRAPTESAAPAKHEVTGPAVLDKSRVN